MNYETVPRDLKQRRQGTPVNETLFTMNESIEN